MARVTMKIDGRSATAERRAPILDAIRELGIHVPTLCHLDGLEPYGVCRLCSVEVKRGRRTRMVTSCNFPAEEGLEIFTDTDTVHAHRAMMAELLLARCPEVEVVRELAASLGVEESRFQTTDPSDCVMCGLCVRVCDELVGASALGFVGRGSERTIGTPWNADPEACIGCGACTYVCPTGAVQMEAETLARWRAELANDRRLCRYARMGLISHKVCPNDFECATCEIDQRFFDELGTHPMLALAPGLRRRPARAGHIALVEDRFYSRGHLWVKPTKDQVRIGLDDFALTLIGDITEVALSAEAGKHVRRGEPAVSVSADGRRTTMLFPVSGEILHANPSLSEDPSLLNEDCYDRGWLYTMRADTLYAELRELVDRDGARDRVLAETDRLNAALSEAGGTPLEDGDEIAPRFAAGLKHEVWKSLAEMFFIGREG